MDSVPFDGGGGSSQIGKPVFMPVMLYNAQTGTWDCSFCDRAFMQPSDLEAHIHNAHGHLFTINLQSAAQESREVPNVAPKQKESPLDHLEEVINSVVDAASSTKDNVISIKTTTEKVETIGGKASVKKETPHRLCIMREKYWCEKCKLGFWKRDCFTEHTKDCFGEESKVDSVASSSGVAPVKTAIHLPTLPAQSFHSSSCAEPLTRSVSVPPGHSQWSMSSNLAQHTQASSLVSPPSVQNPSASPSPRLTVTTNASTLASPRPLMPSTANPVVPMSQTQFICSTNPARPLLQPKVESSDHAAPSTCGLPLPSPASTPVALTPASSFYMPPPSSVPNLVRMTPATTFIQNLQPTSTARMVFSQASTIFPPPSSPASTFCPSSQSPISSFLTPSPTPIRVTLHTAPNLVLSVPATNSLDLSTAPILMTQSGTLPSMLASHILTSPLQGSNTVLPFSTMTSAIPSSTQLVSSSTPLAPLCPTTFETQPTMTAPAQHSFQNTETMQAHPCELCFEVFPSELDLIGHVVDFHCQESSMNVPVPKPLPTTDTSEDFDLSLVDLTSLLEDLPTTPIGPAPNSLNTQAALPFPVEPYEPPLSCWSESLCVKQEKSDPVAKMEPNSTLIPNFDSTKGQTFSMIDVKPLIKQEKVDKADDKTCSKMDMGPITEKGAPKQEVFDCKFCTNVFCNEDELTAHERTIHANIFSRGASKLEEKTKKKKKESSKDIEMTEGSLEGYQYCQNLIDDLKKKIYSAEKAIKTAKRKKKKEEKPEAREEKKWACKVTPSGIKIVTKGPETKPESLKNDSTLPAADAKEKTYECVLCGVETTTVDSFKRHVNSVHAPKPSVPKVNKFPGKPPLQMWEKPILSPEQIPIIDLEDDCVEHGSKPKPPPQKFVEKPRQLVEIIDIADSPEPVPSVKVVPRGTKLKPSGSKSNVNPRVPGGKPYLQVPFKDTKHPVKREPAKLKDDRVTKPLLLPSKSAKSKHKMVASLKPEHSHSVKETHPIKEQKSLKMQPATSCAPKKIKLDREVRIVLKRVDDDDFDFSDVIFLKRLC